MYIAPVPGRPTQQSPNDSEHYLAAPVSMIISSLESSKPTDLHDLLEAYHLLASRIRAQGPSLAQCTAVPACLGPLRTHSDSILKAIQRDVDIDGISDDFTLHHDNEERLATRQQRVCDFRNRYGLGQAVLLLLSVFLKLPIFQLVLSYVQLGTLFDATLRLAISSHVKLARSAVWILRMHSLPSAVLLVRSGAISSTLSHLLEGTDHIVDGLKTVNHYILNDPTMSSSPFSGKVFSLVLKNLVAHDYAFREQAARTLGSFATAAMAPTASRTLLHRLSSQVGRFLDEECSQRPKVSDGDVRLPDLLTTKCSRKEESQIDFRWSMSVLASLIVLSGPALFTRSQSLRLVIKSLERTSREKSSFAQSIFTLTWTCLIHAFAVLLRTNDTFTTACDDPDAQPNFEELDNVVERSFRVLKQELKDRIGIALVGALLTPSTDERGNTHRAVTVLQEILRRSGSSAPAVGLAILWHITKPEPTIARMADTKLVAPVLVDGTMLSDLSVEQLSDRLKGDHSISDVRRLHPNEVQKHRALLVETWEVAMLANLKLGGGKDGKDMLLDIWKAIFRPPMPNKRLDLPDASDIAAVFVHLIKAFLEKSASVDVICEIWESTCVSVVESAVVLMAREIFPTAIQCLSTISSELPRVTASWKTLCGRFMAADPTTASDILRAATGRHIEVSQVRDIWSAASTCSNIPTNHGDAMMSFLKMPMGLWCLSTEELASWRTILHDLLSAANADSPDSLLASVTVLSQTLRDNGLDKFPEWEGMMCILLEAWSELGEDVLPVELLGLASDLLSFGYPSNCEEAPPRLLPLTEKLLRVAKSAMERTTHRFIVQVISALSDGLCLWVRDENAALLEREYIDVIVDLYCNTLSTLDHIPISMFDLQALAPFLASAFFRVPDGARAPLAFASFWASLMGRTELRGPWPDTLKPCLRGLGEAFGLDVPSDLSMESQSQAPTFFSSPAASRYHSSPKHGRESAAATPTATPSRSNPSSSSASDHSPWRPAPQPPQAHPPLDGRQALSSLNLNHTAAFRLGYTSQPVVSVNGGHGPVGGALGSPFGTPHAGDANGVRKASWMTSSPSSSPSAFAFASPSTFQPSPELGASSPSPSAFRGSGSPGSSLERLHEDSPTPPPKRRRLSGQGDREESVFLGPSSGGAAAVRSAVAVTAGRRMVMECVEITRRARTTTSRRRRTPIPEACRQPRSASPALSPPRDQLSSSVDVSMSMSLGARQDHSSWEIPMTTPPRQEHLAAGSEEQDLSYIPETPQRELRHRTSPYASPSPSDAHTRTHIQNQSHTRSLSAPSPSIPRAPLPPLRREQTDADAHPAPQASHSGSHPAGHHAASRQPYLRELDEMYDRLTRAEDVSQLPLADLAHAGRRAHEMGLFLTEKLGRKLGRAAGPSRPRRGEDS